MLKGRFDRSMTVIELAEISKTWLRDELGAAQEALFENARAYRDAKMHAASRFVSRIATAC